MIDLDLPGARAMHLRERLVQGNITTTLRDQSAGEAQYIFTGLGGKTVSA